MGIQKIAGLILLTLGILGLCYKGFTYTKANHSTDLGLFKVSYAEKEHVDIPLWVGVIGVVAGAALFLVPSMRSAKA